MLKDNHKQIIGRIIIITVLFIFAFAVKEATAKTITVDDDGGADYEKIQDAIDNATEGDTVRVWEGTYYENVVVNKTVSLVGNGSEETTIVAGGIHSVVWVEADWVNISGFGVRKSGEDDLGGAGINIHVSSNNNISNCNAYNINLGVLLFRSSNNKISNNNAYNNRHGGITLAHHSSNNSISNCNVYNNSRGGIYIEDSSNDNWIHHNNFINNSKQAYDKCSNNWDDGSKGNYWSDYNGTDTNGDGIGETPYNISEGNNQDRYPFVKPLKDIGPLKDVEPYSSTNEGEVNGKFPEIVYILFVILVILILLIITINYWYPTKK